jgi:hypothetical protein
VLLLTLLLLPTPAAADVLLLLLLLLALAAELLPWRPLMLPPCPALLLLLLPFAAAGALPLVMRPAAAGEPADSVAGLLAVLLLRRLLAPAASGESARFWVK